MFWLKIDVNKYYDEIVKNKLTLDKVDSIVDQTFSEELDFWRNLASHLFNKSYDDITDDERQKTKLLSLKGFEYVTSLNDKDKSVLVDKLITNFPYTIEGEFGEKYNTEDKIIASLNAFMQTFWIYKNMNGKRIVNHWLTD